MAESRPSLGATSTSTDRELLAVLRMAWKFGDEAALLVVGRLSLPATDGANFGFLVDIEDPNSGRKLASPVSDQPMQAFIPPADMVGVRQALRSADTTVWALAEVQLSPRERREQRRDRYALTVVPGSITLLVDLPEEWWGSAQVRRISKTAYDIIVQRLGQQSEGLLQEHKEQVAAYGVQLTGEAAKVEQARAAQASEQTRLLELTTASAGLQQDILLMQERLQTMAALAERQGSRLQALGLIEAEDLARLLPNGPRPASPPGQPFAEALAGDFARVAPFVQSRLWKRGIRYSQAQLRDFLALLRTHDLIVLAGDSGSGKTSIIRHVAEAIGGRHTVIPVKPNWTGPEDLLGYYNPIDRAYQATPFLAALQAAAADPEVVHLICLDEMNLARVEYYFADFLSLLEQRSGSPEITLYASDDERHTVVETGLFAAVEAEVRRQTGLPVTVTIEDILRDETANALLHRLAGLADAQSLLEYHGRLRRSIAAATRYPTRFAFPPNVRIIGSVNMDETTHPLSPKVLDRAHVMRFRNPVLLDWDAMAAEVEDSLEDSEPVILRPTDLAPRTDYPAFEPDDPVTSLLLRIARDFLDPIGVEFGLRAIRQSLGYIYHAQAAGLSADAALNNVVLHKVLPKIAFDAGRKVVDGRTRIDVLRDLAGVLRRENGNPSGVSEDAATALDRMILAAGNNNDVVNFWSR